MTTHDISRFLFQPAKHYIGARWQQGRCLLESDFNEDAQLDDEEQRRALRDVIGPAGSPDEGFSAALVVGDQVPVQAVSFNGGPPTDVLNYGINPGCMYVCGLRFEHEPAGDPIVFQRDFLQMRASDAPLPQPGQTHRQLTILHGTEQCVGAVEDEEIRERALGGTDTSVRIRRTARVEVRDVTEDNCTDAWNTVRAELEAEFGATFDHAGCELRSSARLRITFDDGAAQDPCAPCGPHDAGRYLGADNQAIRIMLVEPPSGANPGRYVWAYDNASPLYRVSLGRDDLGVGGVVTMLTPPRDETRWPLADTVIEILPWGALLDNGQKVSAPIGAFLRVTEGYDPDTGTFRVDPAALGPVDALVQNWDAAHPDIAQLPNTADPDGDYFFMRVWHRVDPTDTEILLDTSADPNNHHLLRRIGLVPEFGGTGAAGDWWVVTVRPNTPQQIVPWDLTQSSGVPPHGPRNFYAPLSLVTFRPPGPGENANTEVVEALHDCRPRFRPLIERTGCCTHTVGDGVTSHGEYVSIQAAIDALPAVGGTVCVLPGRYSEEIVVTRSDVIIEGCGAQTRLETPGGAPATALIHVLAPRVTIRDLLMRSAGQVGVLVGPEAIDVEARTEDVVLERLEIAADQRSGLGGQTRATIDVRNGRRVKVLYCELTMDGSLTDEAGVFVRGEDIRVEHNRIETFPPGLGSGAWGGVQIGGRSERIRLSRNRIVGGIGHGITLGSLVWVPESSDFTVIVLGPGAGQMELIDPCDPRDPTTHAVLIDDVRYDPQSAGDLEHIDILDNHIEGMSGNGISVLTMLPLDEDGSGGPRHISVDSITIASNRIVNNVVQASALPIAGLLTKKKRGEEAREIFGQFRVAAIPPAAIALVDGEHVVIRDNDIRDNGTADSTAICGICIVFGDGIVIEGNRIVNNGRRDPGSQPSAPTTQAGIAITLAGVASDDDPPRRGDTLGCSLRVLGNMVDHPNGPALAARATGPVLVEGNHLQSQGNNASAQRSGAAHAVVIVNVGTPWEGVDLPLGEPSSSRWDYPPGTREYLRGETGEGGEPGVGEPGPAPDVEGEGGRVAFNDNHVTLIWPESNSVNGLAAGFSVAICTMDAVTMCGNQLALNVDDPGKKKKTASGTLSQRPHLTAHAVVVGATANVSSNRVAEGVNDALISLHVLGGFLVTSSYNITTHASFASTCSTFRRDSDEPPSEKPGERVDRGNLVWLRPQAKTSAANLVSQRTINRVANQLSATFCDVCLGMAEPENGFATTLDAVAVLVAGIEG